MSVPKKTGTKIYGRTDGDRINKLDTKIPWLVNNILFCYEGDKHIGNES